MSTRKRRKNRPVRPIPTLAEAEARARQVTEDRRRRDLLEATRLRAARGRILLADARGARLERRAVEVRAERERERLRILLTPVHERLVALARADLLAAVPEMPDAYDWSTT